MKMFPIPSWSVLIVLLFVSGSLARTGGAVRLSLLSGAVKTVPVHRPDRNILHRFIHVVVRLCSGAGGMPLRRRMFPTVSSDSAKSTSASAPTIRS